MTRTETATNNGISKRKNKWDFRRFWLKREEAKGCVICWQCFNIGTHWQSIRDAALSACVSVCGDWRQEELECEEGQAGVPEGRRGRHREVLGVQSVNGK